MLSVVMLSVLMLIVVMLSVVMLSIIMLNIVMLSTVMLSVVAPFSLMTRKKVFQTIGARQEQILSEIVMTYWINFAKTG